MPISDSLRTWAFRYLVPASVKRAQALAAAEELDEYIAALVTADRGTLALTPGRLQQILDSADQGEPLEQALLYEIIQEREPLIAAHIGTRKNAVAGAGWSITSKSDAKRAEELDKVLRNAGLDGALRHLMDFVATGYAGVGVDWDKGGKAVIGFKPVHPTAFAFDLGGNAALIDAQGQRHAMGEWPDGQWLTVYSRSKPGLPTRTGLLRSLVWLYLFRRLPWKMWPRYVEKYGIPFTIAKIEDAVYTSNQTLVREIVAKLAKLGHETAAAVTKSTDIDVVTPPATTADVFRDFLGYGDTIIALLILGQEGTSGPASGFSKGDAQAAVRQDILAADASALIDTVQRQLIVPLCRYRYGMADAGDLTFWIDWEPEEDQAAKATWWKTLSDATGRKVDPEQATDEFGVRFQDAPPPPPPPGQMPPGLQLRDFADTARVPATETALDAIVAEAMRRTVDDPQCLAEWLGPVVATVRKAFADVDPKDPEALSRFRDRIPGLMAALPGVLSEMDSGRFERHLSGAMLAAALNGYVSR